jgi:hypothetical protein
MMGQNLGVQEGCFGDLAGRGIGAISGNAASLTLRAHPVRAIRGFQIAIALKSPVPVSKPGVKKRATLEVLSPCVPSPFFS